MKTIEKICDQIAYHERKVMEYKRVVRLIQRDPQMEKEMELVLEALEKVNII